MKPKIVEYYTGIESEQPFGDEMPNFDICGTVLIELFKVIDVLDVDARGMTSMRREFVCVRHSISKLEAITDRKSETAIPRTRTFLAQDNDFPAF